MEADKSIRSTLINVGNLVDELFKQLSLVTVQKVDSKPPDSLLSVLEDEDALISKLIQHISIQKEEVCKNIKNIQDEVNQTLERTKETILLQLDFQLSTYKSNFEDFKKISKHFNYGNNENEQTNEFSKESFLLQLNNRRSSMDLEMKVKSLLNEAQEHK